MKLILCPLLLFLAATFSYGQSGNYSFPQNVQYPHGYMPASYLDSDFMQEWWDDWKEDYIEECIDINTGIVALMPTADTPQEVKVEGQGWAMMTAAYMDDKETFDGLLHFYNMKTTDRAGGMMGWHVTCDGFIDEGSATDGDLDVAFSLIVAYWQWGEDYLNKAREVIENCEKLIVTHPDSTISVLAAGHANGQPWGGYQETDISYYTPAYFRLFADVTGNDAWNKLAEDTYILLERAAHDETGLVPDWQHADGTPGAGERVGYYAFDACRTPWRIALDYLWNGDERAKDWLVKVTGWAHNQDRIVDGYELDGTPRGSNTNIPFVGGFAVGAMANSQEVVDDFAAQVRAIDENYWYGRHLGNVYLLALTGNMWSEDIVADMEGTYPLMTEVVGRGRVRRDPNAIRYQEGTEVTLSAEPASGWAFEGWSGEGVSGSENPLTITVNGETNITATFVLDFDPTDPTSNLLENGDFSSGYEFWNFHTWDESEADSSLVDGELTISVTRLGDEEQIHNIQLVQGGVPLEEGQEYILTFDASAAEEREIEVLAQLPDNPWTVYASEMIELTTEKETHVVGFTMENETNINSRIGFNFGNVTGDITVSNVRLTFAEETSVSPATFRSNRQTGLKVTPYSNSAVNISFSPNTTGDAVLKIYSPRGNVVETASIKAVAGVNATHTFNAANVPNGYYIARVYQGGTAQQARFVLSR
ncbi:glycosyl hydrolase family 8 [Chitinispirillales bacterium ANBcel5]|uniref:glycosyl hydrolase family 8 n=1 Tax=Cellulosispirillum alkaliphilum TaxID=3039283 RepID=UPI002A57BD9E|nr:glycosyl hydrolase family 8 [Chitinispirillales bacterium ANBcel5]